MNLYDIVNPMTVDEAKAVKQRLDPKCWKGKHKEGTKVKGGVRVNNCVPNESVEEAVMGGTGGPTAEAEVKKIIWDTLHIDKPTAKEAVEAAIQMLSERPKTRMVKQLMGHLKALSDRARLQLDPLMRGILNHYNESVEEDSWHGTGDAWSGEGHEMVEDQLDEYPTQGASPDDSQSPIHGGIEEEHDPSPVASAIVRRIMFQHPELLKQYGPNLVNAAVDNVADYVGDVDEIGSSDVSAWVAQVERMLKENPPESFDEGYASTIGISPPALDPASKWKFNVRQLIADYIKNPQGLYNIAKQKGSDSAEAMAYQYIMNPKGKIAAKPAVTAEGFQDFNKVEPYAVCLAGKPVKKFDYYEQARKFHDNWKQKLYREGDKAKADKITLMPLNLDEEEDADQIKKVFKDKSGKPVGEIGIDPESSPGNGEWYVHHYATGYSVVGFDSAAEAKRELMYVHKHPDAVDGHESTLDEQGVTEAEGRVDPILIKALNNMPDGLATHHQVLDAAYDAYTMEVGKIHIKQNYGVTNVYIPKLMQLYKDKHGLDIKEAGSPAQQAAIAIAKKKQQGVDENTGSWIVYDPETKQIKKRFKTHTAGKSYAKVHGLGFASSEYYFDNVKEKTIAEFAPSPERDNDKVPDQILKLANRWWNATDDQPKITNVLRSLGWSIAQVESEDDAVQMQHDDGTTYFISADDFDPDVFEASTDYQKRRQRERDVDVGKPVARQAKNPKTDYAKRRAQDKKEMALGESYWTRLQNERNTKTAGLVAELQETIKDIK